MTVIYFDLYQYYIPNSYGQAPKLLYNCISYIPDSSEISISAIYRQESIYKSQLQERANYWQKPKHTTTHLRNLRVNWWGLTRLRSKNASPQAITDAPNITTNIMLEYLYNRGLSAGHPEYKA